MRKYFLIIISLFVFIPAYAHAQVLINEVRIDGGEFVELYNPDSTPTSLKNYYFTYYSGTQPDWTKPFRSKLFPDTATIQAGSYYLIALGEYTGTLDWQPYTSSFLSNGAGTVAIWDGDPKQASSEHIDVFGWGSALLSLGQPFIVPDTIPAGASFSRKADTDNNATDFITTPDATPGELNSVDNNNSDTPPANPDPVAANPLKNIIEPTISTKIILKNKAFVGLPTTFSSTTLGYSREELLNGVWSWNFGDGTIQEDTQYLSDKKMFNHVFAYPGEYVVTLEYKRNAYIQNPDALDRMTVNVSQANVAITNVSYDAKEGIEITNTTPAEIDISGWIIRSGESRFILPKNSIIMANKKMMISGAQLGLKIQDGGSVSISYPDGTQVSVFPKDTVARSDSKVRNGEVVESYSSVSDSEEKSMAENLLSAQVAQAADGSDKNSDAAGKPGVISSGWLYGGLAGILIIAAWSSVYIRRKKASGEATEADSFTLVE